jgi:hypothetical protein
LDIREFVSSLQARTHARLVLVVGYYLEVVQQRGYFTSSDIRSAIVSARVGNAPKNVPDVLASLRLKGKLVVIKKTPVRRYALSQKALETLTQEVASAGWSATAPSEPTKVIREISETLNSKVLQISDPDEQGYIQEAIMCLHPAVNAYRAAIVMGWTAAMYNLRRKIGKSGVTAFNARYQARFPKSKRKPITSVSD